MTTVKSLRLDPILRTTRIKHVGGLVVAAALVCVGACQPKVAEQSQSGAKAIAEGGMQAATPAPSPAKSAEAPAATSRASARDSRAETESAAGGSAGITGGWVNAGGACDSGAAVMFNPDGTYLSEGETGTWALSGKTLTVTTTTFADGEVVSNTPQGPEQSTGEVGEKSVLTVLSITDEAAQVVLSNGSNANWTRCEG